MRHHRPHVGPVGILASYPLIGNVVADARHLHRLVPYPCEPQLRKQWDLEEADGRPVEHPLLVGEDALDEGQGAVGVLGQEVLLKNKD